jgi:hypothetical protein
METKIIKTVKEWLPWTLENEGVISEYTLLNKLASYCRMKIKEGESEKANQVIKIINLLYSGGNLHEKNAIENEFLEVLALDESPSSLKDHLSVFPKNLKEAYLRTILEN